MGIRQIALGSNVLVGLDFFGGSHCVCSLSNALKVVADSDLRRRIEEALVANQRNRYLEEKEAGRLKKRQFFCCNACVSCFKSLL